MIHTVPGMEDAHIVRNAYAIEYDLIDPNQLSLSLQCRVLSGFFSAGQANGSSGYEEAAAQGLIAGINAARWIKGQDPLILDRSQAYIGVLIDDLVTKENFEPYRMMTSRAEYRLLLRQDNADLRLSHIGHEIGLISDERYEKLINKERIIAEECRRLENTYAGATDEVNAFLDQFGSTHLVSGMSLAELLKRPELDYEKLAAIDKNRPAIPADAAEQVNISLKYEGYIRRQMQQVEHFRKLEGKLLPEDMEYGDMNNLRLEARQKLSRFRPRSIGQASRISGVSPADISVLLVWLEQHTKIREGE